MIIWTQLPLFLYSGTLEVVLGSIVKQNGDLVRNAVVDTRTKGSYFGDIALIWDRTRSATLRCKNNVKIWRLSRNDFLRFISHSNRLVKDLFGGMKWTLIRISYWNLWHMECHILLLPCFQCSFTSIVYNHSDFASETSKTGRRYITKDNFLKMMEGPVHMLEEDEYRAVTTAFARADRSKNSMLSFTEWILFIQSLDLATDESSELIRKLFDRVHKKVETWESAYLYNYETI